jgi:hypothetical protein
MIRWQFHLFNKIESNKIAKMRFKAFLSFPSSRKTWARLIFRLIQNCSGIVGFLVYVCKLIWNFCQKFKNDEEELSFKKKTGINYFRKSKT